jgi:RNA-binding protein YlmH
MNLELFLKALTEQETLELRKLLNNETQQPRPLNKWFESHKHLMSVRLKALFEEIIKPVPVQIYDYEKKTWVTVGWRVPYQYLEELTREELLKYRNFGHKSLKEFEEIKSVK